MGEQTPPSMPNFIDHAAIEKALELATRDALLEHARMGRSVSESRDGKIVTVTPEEIFARYGLDENGKPKPSEAPTMPTDPLLESQMAEWRKLDELYNAGQLNDYRGEYVIWADGTVFAHGRNLFTIRPQAEELAAARGIAPDQLTHYFVPGE